MPIDKLRNAAVLNGTPSTLSGVVVEIRVVLLVVVVMVGYWPFAIKLRPRIHAVNGGGSDSLRFQFALLKVGYCYSESIHLIMSASTQILAGCGTNFGYI